MLEWTPDVCLYHFPCDDGFAAAWTVRRRWPDCRLEPTNYGLPLPDISFSDLNVLIVDFSLNPAALTELAAKARSVVIIDHHKTAMQDLAHLRCVSGHDFISIAQIFVGKSGADAPGNVAAIFDMDKSGAMLTWDLCFPHSPVPELIRIVEDRDLYRFRLRDTRPVSLLLRSFPYDFDVWTGIATAIHDGDQELLSQAHGIERFYDAKIAEIVPTATLQTIGRFDGVPVAHAPYAFVSDLGHALLNAHPQAPFAAVVVDAYGARTFSLRSEDSRQDVSEVARMFGGGGHRNAAGFRVPVV